jgi:hypothetical protein
VKKKKQTRKNKKGFFFFIKRRMRWQTHTAAAEDHLPVRETNHTNTSKVCGAPATAPPNCTRKEGREEIRERERDALAKWRWVGKNTQKTTRTQLSAQRPWI